MYSVRPTSLKCLSPIWMCFYVVSILSYSSEGGMTYSLFFLNPKLLFSSNKLLDKKFLLSFWDSSVKIKRTQATEITLSIQEKTNAVLDFWTHDCNGHPWLVFNHFHKVLVDDSFGERVKIKVEFLVFWVHDFVQEFQFYLWLADQVLGDVFVRQFVQLWCDARLVV
jgi:hypothetical protein